MTPRWGIVLAGGVALQGCLQCLSSLTPCPAPRDVEKHYRLETTCADGGTFHLRVHDLEINRMNDCPAGCFSTARAPVEIDGGLPVAADFYSSCGDDPGTLRLQFFPSGPGFPYCQVPLDRLGQDVPCGADDDAGVCALRLTVEAAQ
jgi:hypothetical protein